MPLKVSDGIGAWIKDFQKSDAPQFKNSSKSDRRDQAIAAYLGAKRGDTNEAYDNPPFTPDPPKKDVKNSDQTKQSPMSRAKALAKKARDAQPEAQAAKRREVAKRREDRMKARGRGPGFEESTNLDENNFAPRTAAHRRAMMIGVMKDRAKENEKARQALKDPDHNPAWANSKTPKSKLEATIRGKEAYDKTFANRTQADNFAKKNGGRVRQIGRVFYVFKESVNEDVKKQIADLEKMLGRISGNTSSVKMRKYALQKKIDKLKSGVNEGRVSQQHPLEDHPYHRKTDAQLTYIGKDAHAAAEAMKGHNTEKENKYRDQANDAATVRHFRKKNGMPDWYKKKYGHGVKESVELKEATDVTRPLATTKKYSGSEHEDSKSPVRLSGRERAKHLEHEEEFRKRAEYHRNESKKDGASLDQKIAHRKAAEANHLAGSMHFRVRRESDNSKPATAGALHRAHHAANKALEASNHKDIRESVKESVELDESVAKAYEIMKPTKSMNHGIEAIKKTMKIDHGTATRLARQVMDKVKKGEFKEGTADRYNLIKKIGDKINKEKKKAERDAMRHAKRDNEYQTDVNESSASDEGARAASQGQSYSSNPYPKDSPNHVEWSKGHNKARARRLDMGESKEEFTKKHFHKNEDENRHTENGVKLVNKFGTSAENIKMGGIAARHNMRGSISRKDQQDRDALVRKYYPKLKEGTSVKKTNEATQFKVDIDGLPPTFIQGKSVGEIMANLRKIVKQPSLIKDVERVTDYTVKKTYRAKSQGREVDEAANPDEGSMALTQLEFIEYAAEELSDHIKKGGDFPEWMQNKLTKAHTTMEGLHSSMGDHGGDDDENEKDD